MCPLGTACIAAEPLHRSRIPPGTQGTEQQKILQQPKLYPHCSLCSGSCRSVRWWLCQVGMECTCSCLLLGRRCLGRMARMQLIQTPGWSAFLEGTGCKALPRSLIGWCQVGIGGIDLLLGMKESTCQAGTRSTCQQSPRLLQRCRAGRQCRRSFPVWRRFPLGRPCTASTLQSQQRSLQGMGCTTLFESLARWCTFQGCMACIGCPPFRCIQWRETFQQHMRCSWRTEYQPDCSRRFRRY